MHEVRAMLGDIPVLLVAPDRAARGTGLTLWLTHLGGSADKERPTLERLVEAGHVAVSFDPPGHGSRADVDDPRRFAADVLGSFRQSMWPILGQATVEAMRVITWAQDQLDVSDHSVGVGGVSMGGDVAVALAGIDDRIGRVAAVGSTPNWQRPGMRSLGDASQVVEQGEADKYARWYAQHLDPSRHLERYVAGPSITFELGGNDRHIPAGNAVDFRAALEQRSAGAGERIAIHVHDGLDHFGVTTDDAALDSAVHALTR